MNDNASVHEVREWNLTPETEKKILLQPSLVNYLNKQKAKYPLPPNYVPYKIEVLANNSHIIFNSVDGEIVYSEPNLPDIPYFWEYRYDGECALFIADDRLLIDRTKQIKSMKNLEEYHLSS